MDTLTTTQSVQEYYGKTLQSSKDLKTTACCSAAARAWRCALQLWYPFTRSSAVPPRPA